MWGLWTKLYAIDRLRVRLKEKAHQYRFSLVIETDKTEQLFLKQANQCFFNNKNLLCFCFWLLLLLLSTLCHVPNRYDAIVGSINWNVYFRRRQKK